MRSTGRPRNDGRRQQGAPGNVGYLKFNAFADPNICEPTVAAAFGLLANVDALVVDLRENGGGSPEMVRLVCSHLFSKRTHVNDLWTRATNTRKEFWTSDTATGPRIPDRVPVYVLTSRGTFSAAEEFAYDLQALKRATVVGETIGEGGAHPLASFPVGRFVVGVPYAKSIKPTTHADWECVGVEPDVKVAAGEALATAQRLIAERRGPVNRTP